MAGYTRQSVADIIDGEIIYATPINNEFNAIASAFNGTTGHGHTGGSGDAPKISLTAAVSGTLPLTNGGTGVTSIAALRTSLYTAVITGIRDATNPFYTFDTDPDTGMGQSASNTLYFKTGGTDQLVISTNTITHNLVTRIVDGTAPGPALRFTNDPDTGIYSAAADQFGISTGGVARAVFGSTNTITGNTTITGNLTSTGTGSIGGALTVSGVSTFNTAVNIAGTLTLSGSVVADISTMSFSNNSFTIRANTSDDADTKRIVIAGGGGVSTSRGAYITLYGNEESSNPGVAIINAGVTGGITLNGNTGVTQQLAVTGTTSLLSTLAVTGATTLSSTLNVSGATTLSSTLSTTGNISTNGVYLTSATGTAAAPDYTWTGDTDTGIYRIAANQIGLSTGGTARVTITSAGLNMVGAGTITIGGNEVWHPNNDGPGSGLDADTVDGVQLAGLVQTSRTVTAGNGLTGGGDLSANRTVTLGTPGALSATSTDAVTTTSHTHSINSSSVVSAGSAALALGAIGTYALLRRETGSAVGPGGTVAGADLRYTSASGTTIATPVPSGTWRCMGNDDIATLYLRIS